MISSSSVLGTRAIVAGFLALFDPVFVIFVNFMVSHITRTAAAPTPPTSSISPPPPVMTTATTTSTAETYTAATTSPTSEKAKLDKKIKAVFETLGDSNKFKAKVEAKRAKGEVAIVGLVCLLVPILVALALGALTVLIASFVFAIQALVVGVEYYPSKIQCESTMGVWMVVYGSLAIGVSGLQCLCNGVPRGADDNDDDDKPPGSKPLGPLINLINLASFGWLCYGMNIILANTDHVGQCNDSLYGVFHLMIYFMFFGTMAILCALCFILCGVIPAIIVLGLVDEDGVEASATSIPAGKAPLLAERSTPTATAATSEATPVVPGVQVEVSAGDGAHGALAKV